MLHHSRVLAVGLATLLGCAATAAAQTPAAAPDSRERNLRAYVELLRSDVRSQKIAIITELMPLSEKEDDAFWPIYRAYDGELTTLNDERLKLIVEYAKAYGTIDDSAADKLAVAALGLEGRRHELKQKYYERIKSALSATQAARFLQIENQLLLLIDLQIASALPIIE